MTRIEVVIDELVLHGIEPHRRHAVLDAVQRELSMLSVYDLITRSGATIARDSERGAERADASGVGTSGSPVPAALLSERIGAAVTRAVGGVVGGRSDRSTSASAGRVGGDRG